MRFTSLLTTLQLLNLLKSQQDTSLDTLDLDLDALWENTVWEEITEVTNVYGEVEQITPVAGVRGAEAEDEALEYLYYRKTMKRLTTKQINDMIGKLIAKRDTVEDPTKINQYISVLRNKLRKM